MKSIYRVALAAWAGVAILAMVSTATNAQAKTLKQQLVGTWTVVSNITMHPDGSKYEAFGGHTTGILILDRSGHFAEVLTGDARMKFASNNRLAGSADENKGVVQGSLAYFGTYSVSEADHTLIFHVAGSTFANWDGTDQKRTASVTGNELKWHTAAASGGGTADLVWKRGK
jgi:hypothetical protein